MKARPASANDWSMAKVCTIRSSLRLSDRSATKPGERSEDQDRAELGRGEQTERRRRCR